MGRMKKGIVTLSIFFLASAILYLLATVSLYSSSQQTVNSGLSDIEALGQRADAVSYGIKSIAIREAVNVTYSGNNISFRQNLSATNYLTDLLRFQEFVTGRNAAVNISINTNNASRPQLLVSPQLVIIDNAPGRITFIPQDSAASSGQVLGYTVLIRANFQTPAFNWTNYTPLAASNPNVVLLKVSLQGTNGTVTNISYVDKTATSQVQLLDASNFSLVTIRIANPAALYIYYNSTFSVETVLALNSSSSVELGANIINVTMSDGLARTDRVILGEG